MFKPLPSHYIFCLYVSKKVQGSSLVMSSRIVYSLLVCAIISGLAAHQVYRETFSWFQPENTSLRFQYPGGRKALQREEDHAAYTERLRRIEDVVLLSENQLLLSVRLPFKLPPKSALGCVFPGKITTPVLGIDYGHGRAAIRCEIPSPSLDVTSTGRTNLLSLQHMRSRPVKWDRMVYESTVTRTDVVLFAKGINPRQGINAAPQTLRCVFNNTVQTAVTHSAQEIFRCAHPPKHLRSQLSGAKITLRSLSFQMPSVAYYYPHSHDPTKESKKFLCACTMVYNAAKFMKEWIIYHSYLGVEEFFIYDNSSDDDLEQVIRSLSRYNVSRHPWPWPKTQEAGFGHCALLATNKCQWMMFTDVDEFVFSHRWLDRSPSSNALKSFLSDKILSLNGSMVGQVSMNCRNFGASNLKQHPAAGVTQGYTCRERVERRHKSVVRLDALSSSLVNAVHHFELKAGYQTIGVKSWEAVINHYKYQAWSEFKQKFRRRVSAYVVDWKQEKNPTSRDRAPGVGYEAVQPPAWEKKFCEVNDTGLLQFTAKVFSVKNGSLSLMQWQL